MKKCELIGTLSETETLEGHLSGTGELEGDLTIPEVVYKGEIYENSFEITPSSGFQLLPTAGCYLSDDILIHPVPYQAVSNPSGGYTITIGG